MSTLDGTRTSSLFYELSVTDLSAAASTGDTSDGNYAILDADPVPHPTLANTNIPIPENGVGMAVNGIVIFPIYNNNGQYTPAKCETDSCGEHVGQGGGHPHYHSDPFGDQDTATSAPTSCLYGPSNYTSNSGTAGDLSAHPPVVGFSFDGHLIYGRYLSSTSPGFQAPNLDNCGGHYHAEAGTDQHGFDLQANYHYHMQVFDATCGSGDMCTSGESYKASTTGPFNCFKQNLATSAGSSATVTGASSTSYAGRNAMEYRCCGMTDYYALTGLAFGNNDVAESSTCTAPANPVNGAYSGSCAAGSTLYSGNTCTPTCDSGYTSSSTTRCVGGSITETATCVSASGTTTASPPLSPPPPSPPPPSPSPPVAEAVLYTATAAGSVVDFTDMVQMSLRAAVASGAGGDSSVGLCPCMCMHIVTCCPPGRM